MTCIFILLMWHLSQKNSLARITLLSCMQDDLMIEYEVYQTSHEMWETLKEKYDGLSATKLRGLVMKFGNYKMRLNHTMKQHPKEMKRIIKELKNMLTDDQQVEKVHYRHLFIYIYIYIVKFFLKIKNFKIAYSKFNFFLFSISNPIQHYYI